MPDYQLGNKTVSLRPSDVIGQGGEADIYRKGGEAFKVFKSPTHPDLADDITLQNNAKEKLAEHQKKLPALRKLRLPPRAAMPGELLLDKRGMIAGYQMNFVDDVEVLYRYGERSFRQQGVPEDFTVKVLADLHRTVVGMHAAGAVISDFNDLNVLVKNKTPEAYLIDIDSIGFGPYLSKMFTAQFVDPLICDPKGSSPMMVRPHTPETDWYAYLIMVMRTLLFVGPYGGVYRPKDQKKAVAHDARPLRRITVFDPEVRYPKPARPYKILPDGLLTLFEQAFVKDKRGVPPISLIESLRFTKCSKCGAVHARSACPDCVGMTAPMLKEVVTGKVKGFKAFDTSGMILYASMQNGRIRYLYHHDGSYKRDGDRKVVDAPLEPNIRYRIKGDDTIIAQGARAFIFESAKAASETISCDAYGQLPLIDANGDNIFVSQGGAFNRIGDLGHLYPERVGDVLENQTLFWVGEKTGFGFYRAAELSNYFVFRTDHRGLNDSVKIPSIRGQLVDSTCCFSRDLAWFFMAVQEGGRAINRCFLVNDRGDILGSAETTAGDGSWLGAIRGACAAGKHLFVPTDDGVMRVALSGASLDVDKVFSDTTRFVDASTSLFAGNDGLYVVSRHDIWRIVMS